MTTVTRPRAGAKRRSRASHPVLLTHAALAEASDAALINLVVGRSTTRKHLLTRDGIAGLCGDSPRALSERGDLSPDEANRLAAALHLSLRLMRVDRMARKPWEGPADAAAWLSATIGELRHEEIWVVGLDTGDRFLGARCVAKGAMTEAVIDVPTVLRHVIELGASAFILGHNHPGGDLTPSDEDVLLTRAIDRGSKVIDVPLLDHVIVGPGARHMLLDRTTQLD